MQITWYGHPAQSPLSSVTIQNVISLYTLIHLYLCIRTKKPITTLNSRFDMKNNLTKRCKLIEIDNVLQKRTFYKSNMSA